MNNLPYRFGHYGLIDRTMYENLLRGETGLSPEEAVSIRAAVHCQQTKKPGFLETIINKLHLSATVKPDMENKYQNRDQPTPDSNP